MATNKKTSPQNKSAKSSTSKGKPGPKKKTAAPVKKQTTKAAPKKKPTSKASAPKKAAPKTASARAKTSANSDGIDVWAATAADHQPFANAIDPMIASVEASVDSAISKAASVKGGLFARFRAWLRSA
jgi:hypothetical protein